MSKTFNPTAVREIKTALRELNVSQNFLARYLGLSSAEISSRLSSKRLLAATAADMLRGIDDLRLVVAAASPFPVRFDDVDVIRDIVSRLHSGRLLCARSEDGRTTIVPAVSFDGGMF